MLSIVLWGTFSVSICFILVKYVNKHKDEPLTSKHILRLALIWVVFKLLLIPINVFDFFFHHQWKMIMYNLPYDQIYDKRCFGFDYPPLFALV